MADQHVDRGRVGFVAGPDQRGAPGVVAQLRPGAVVEQHLEHGRFLVAGREHERRLAIGVLRVDVGALVEQELDRLRRRPGAHGGDQRRVGVVAGLVRVRAAGEKHGHDVDFRLVRRGFQQRVAWPLRPRRELVGRRAGIEQQFDRAGMILRHGPPDRREEGRRLVGVGVVREQRGDDGVIAPAGGVHQRRLAVVVGEIGIRAGVQQRHHDCRPCPCSRRR